MLPGRLCIGIIEEDNPYKAYFRLKPLLVEKDGRYEPFVETENFPEDGCIRIVPDKNESSHFKSRMRRMGPFCVLDLRDYGSENSKIRPNKNYRIDDGERNACIVYSDVVREPAQDMIFEVVDEPRIGIWRGKIPATARLVERDSNSTWAYLPPTERDGDGSIAPDNQNLDEARLQRFDLEGFPGQMLHFAILMPDSMPSVTATPQPRPFFGVHPVMPAQQGYATARPLPEAYDRSFSTGVSPAAQPMVSPVNTASLVDTGTVKAEPSAEIISDAAAQPSDTMPDSARPANPPAPAQPSHIAVPTVSEPPFPQRGDKPWITRDTAAGAQIPNYRGRPTNLRQSLEAQSGLNPKRSRSLQEIIDDKWRHSRVDQLGHPIPATAMGQPVENPLERTLDGLREAWRMPELRERLLSSISEMDEFSDAIAEMVRRERDGALRRDLEELEAERLKSLDDIEKLRREKDELRETFKQEIREEEEEAFRDAVERTRAAKEECERQEAAAKEARKATVYAEDFMASLSDGRFEEKLKEFAFTSKAVELLRRTDESVVPIPSETPSDETPSANEWIERTRLAFAQEGLDIEPAQAANLLICASLSDLILISGPASSDKEATARAIARALGALKPGRCVEISGETDAKNLSRPSELPKVAIVRDANAHPDQDVDRGLCGTSRDLLVIATLDDNGSGYPVSAEALERGFLVRLEPAGAQAPWRPAPHTSTNFSPMRMDALRGAFLDELPADVPAGLDRRLQMLRDSLARDGVRLSRHTLDLMWRYCAAMIKLNRVSAGEALDLAFAQKALPCILAEAPIGCLVRLRHLLAGMPHSRALLDAPLPIAVG